ncbi:MAG: AMP-binding protein, partial [Actinobacteria bacterium]|nr:AMP-binding protein [Actinomycetota bacterium]
MSAPATIPELVAAAADRFADGLAVVDGDVNLTYRELGTRSRQISFDLKAFRISPGDRVAIWSFNSVEWILAALGIWQAGAVLVPVNTRFKGAEAADILGRSGAKLLFTATDFLGTDYVELLRASGAELRDLETTVVLRGPAPDGCVAWDDFV